MVTWDAPSFLESNLVNAQHMWIQRSTTNIMSRSSKICWLCMFMVSCGCSPEHPNMTRIEGLAPQENWDLLPCYMLRRHSRIAINPLLHATVHVAMNSWPSQTSCLVQAKPRALWRGNSGACPNIVLASLHVYMWHPVKEFSVGIYQLIKYNHSCGIFGAKSKVLAFPPFNLLSVKHV